jgi:hypothetical protein
VAAGKIKTLLFLRAWIAGYYRPKTTIHILKGAPAPLWGFTAVIIRGLLDSLLLYLPLYLSGQQPSTPSALSFLSTSDYYAASVLFSSVFFLVQWLFLSALIHLIIRLAGKESNIDLVLNINGLVSLSLDSGRATLGYAVCTCTGVKESFLRLDKISGV